MPMRATSTDHQYIAEDMKTAVGEGVDILLVGLTCHGYEWDDIKEASEYAEDNDVLIIAPAGNNGLEDNTFYPTVYDWVLSVGATDENDQRWSGSTYGDWLDIMAPGTNIDCTVPDNKYGYFPSSTCPAAALVAGVAALWLSKHPLDTPAQVIERICSTADDIGVPGWDKYTGYGRINAYRVVPVYDFFEITQPDGLEDFADESFIIKWGGYIQGATQYIVSLHYDTDNTGYDGIQINSEPIYDQSSGSYNWNVNGIPEGKYWIHGILSGYPADVLNTYSGHLYVDHTSPIVSVTSPDGGEQWEIGKTYSVKCHAADNMRLKKIEFYFTTNYQGTTTDWSAPFAAFDIHPSVLEDDFSADLDLSGFASSNNCRIKVVAYDGTEVNNYTENISDGNFSICWLTSDIAEATAYNNQRKLVLDSDKNLHLVFSDGDSIRYAMSEDNGETWPYKDWTVGKGDFAALSLDSRNDPNISFIKNNTQVCTLFYVGKPVPTPILTKSAGQVARFMPPAIMVDSNDIVHIIAESERFGDTPIMHYWKLEHGEFKVDEPENVVWETIASYGPTQIEEIPEPEYSPSLDIDENNNLYVVYNNNGTIYYKTKIGGQWQSSYNLGSGSHPCIDVARKYVHIVWESDEPSNIQEIHFPIDRTPSQGTQVNISKTTTESKHPVIVNGSQILWQEHTITNPYGVIYWSQFTGSKWSDGEDIAQIAIYGECFPQAVVERKTIGPNDPVPISGWPGILHFVYTYGKSVSDFYKIRSSSKDIIIPHLESGLITCNANWQTNTYITGDATIAPGVTLTVNPEMTVYFNSQDDRNSGQDTTVPEIEVYGTLIADSAQFIISSENGKQYWRVETFGAEASATFTDCSIGHEGDLLFCSNTGSISPQVNEERLTIQTK